MKNFFYHMSKDRYFISDLEFCSESDHTFDTTFNDLANNEKLLNLLWLYYMQGNYGVHYTYSSRSDWFRGYITAFISDSKERDEMYEKLKWNPLLTVRILILDEELFQKVDELSKSDKSIRKGEPMPQDLLEQKLKEKQSKEQYLYERELKELKQHTDEN
jgi:hypothetical protein